jgi:hypothetical protein
MVDSKEEAKGRFAAEQSRQDRQHAVEYVKAVLQLLMGTSGVAITATLALSGALKDALLIHRMVFAMALYFATVFMAMLSAYCMFLAKQRFGHRWEGLVFGYPESEREGSIGERKAIAKLWHRLHWGGLRPVLPSDTHRDVGARVALDHCAAAAGRGISAFRRAG